MTLLRMAQVADIPAIFDVRYAVTENTLQPGRIDDAEVADAITRTGRGWVVEVDGRIVGFSIGNAQTGSIWALFVHPEHAGRGYGRQLHEVMIEWLWAQGLEALSLSTGPGTRAQAFYEQAGWRQNGLTDSGEIRFELTAHRWSCRRSSYESA
ncbi:GNAT family N-acetyltransferase [Chitinimonas naiadis]